MSRERTPRAVWLATAALGLLVVLWSVAVPAYRAPDEPQYLSTALRMASGGGYPPPGSALLAPAVAASYPYADFPGGDQRTFVPPRKVTRPHHSWPSFRALADEPVPSDQVGQIDQMTQHPPLWPLLGAAELDGLGLRDLRGDLALLLLRILQGLLLLPLPWLAWRTARLLGARRRAASAVGFLSLSAPQLLHIGASVTNGDLLLLLFSVATWQLVATARGDRRPRHAVGLGVVVAAAMLTKSFGLVLLPVTVLAYAAAARGVGWRAVVRPAATALGIALAAGGWWYVLRYVQLGSLQPSGYPDDVEARLAGTVGFSQANSIFWGSLVKTLWSDLGWFETPAPFKVVLPPEVALAALVSWAMVRGKVDRWAGLVALAPFLVLLPVVVGGAYRTWRDLHAVYGAQGRYLFPALVGVAGLLAVALSAPSSPLVRRVAVTVLPLGCLLSQTLGLNLALGHFWSAQPEGALHTALGASPLPFWVVVAVAAGVVASVVAAATALGSSHRSGGGSSDGDAWGRELAGTVPMRPAW